MEVAGEDAQKNASANSGVGTLLCATRMRLSIDLQRVAEVLHIRYNYLVAIEDGRYEDLPGQAYAIGFVRAYADHLGLDGDEIVRRYKEESSGLKTRAVFEFPLPAPDSGVPSGALILVAIVMGMVVYGVWYAVAGSDRGAVQVIQEVPARLAALLNPNPALPPAPVAAPDAGAVATETGNALQTEGDSGAMDSETDTAAAGISDDETPAPQFAPGAADDAASQTAPPPANVPADVVELRAKADIWITLKAPEQADRTQMLRKGEIFRAPEGGGGMTVVTAKPSDLEILVNGQVMPPLDAGVFARGVPLDPQHLKGSPTP
jgi:cytoskeleton protein RodZ